ncbi:unnamed protein product [Parnassius mnemosyne]|uniref:Malate dehydrogenase, mitochondrial n=1 Tax=Parnassius mnemosyne TaxID=213953 RepID=A0AAV1K8Y5_9NEOP
MLISKLKTLKILFHKDRKIQVTYIHLRNIQVSIIGAVCDIGANLALLLKRNNKISRLHLYDNYEKVNAIGLELSHLPGGPHISSFVGECMLSSSIRYSDLVVMVDRIARKPGNVREQMIPSNTPLVYKLCKVMCEQNSNAILAISTSPINSIVPFASALLYKYGSYNPFKVFGITHLDVARVRTLTASALQVNPTKIYVPVIGGHSDETIVPLFSNISPNCYTLDEPKTDMLTKLLRKSGTEVVNKKLGIGSATLAMAWSVNEFVDCILDAIRGAEVMVNAYTANPHFGTKYFSGPTLVGSNGIIQPCFDFSMSDYEHTLLNTALPIINRDVIKGEQHVQIFESISKKI